MPQYSGSYTTPRLDLGQALAEFDYLGQGFIGRQVLPVTPVAKKDGVFTALTRESITRPRNVKRAAKGAYNRDDHEITEISYSCVEYGHEQPVDDVERATYATDYDADLTAAQLAKYILMCEEEKRIRDALWNTTTFTGAALYTDVSSAPWDNAASDVIGHVEAAKQAVLKNCGMMPDTMVLGYQQLCNLKVNTAIKDNIKYTNTILNNTVEDLLAQMFGIQRVLVGRAVAGTHNEGGTFSSGFIWGDDYCWIGVTGGGNLALPSCGRLIAWSGDGGEMTVEQYREEQTRSDIFRVRQFVQEKIIDPYFGHLLKID